MKKLFKTNKLNNKGFTLIELLAVVVILAVVMGIAVTNVLSSMNKARGGSLADTATTIAQAFNQKYTESLVDGVPSDVYGDILTTGNGFDFQSDAIYYIPKGLADTFNISDKSYNLEGSGEINVTDTATTSVTSSFVSFNVGTGKFIVCMVAGSSGNVYVDNYKIQGETALQLSGVDTPTEDDNIKDIYVAAGTMMACSDGTKTWK